MIEGVNPVPPQKANEFDPTSRQKEEARLKDASQQFEQVFMKQMLSEMRKSVDKSKLFGEGKDEDTFQDMLDNERAKSWSQSGGVGLAQLIYEQMRSQIGDKPAGQEMAGQLESATAAIDESEVPSTLPTPDKLPPDAVKPKD